MCPLWKELIYILVLLEATEHPVGVSKLWYFTWHPDIIIFWSLSWVTLPTGTGTPPFRICKSFASTRKKRKLSSWFIYFWWSPISSQSPRNWLMLYFPKTQFLSHPYSSICNTGLTLFLSILSLPPFSPHSSSLLVYCRNSVLGPSSGHLVSVWSLGSGCLAAARSITHTFS